MALCFSACQKLEKVLSEFLSIEREYRYGLAFGKDPYQVFYRAIGLFLFRSHGDEHCTEDAYVHVCLAVY